MRPKQTIIDDPLRMEVAKDEIKVFQEDFAIMGLKRKYATEVLALLGHGDLYMKRLELESQRKPLTDEVKAVKNLIPSFRNLLKKRCAEVKHPDSEHELIFLPWTADDGSTQFMVEMAHFPKEGKPSHVASLTHWQIPMIIRMLRKVLENGDV